MEATGQFRMLFLRRHLRFAFLIQDPSLCWCLPKTPLSSNPPVSSLFHLHSTQGYKTHPDLFLRCRWNSGSAAHRKSTVQTDLSPPFMTTAFLKSRRRRSLTLTNAPECLVGQSQCHIRLHSHLAVRTEHGWSVVSPKAERDSSRSGE